MDDNEGCPSAFLCDDCCKAADHQHPWLKPQPRKEATMQSYIKQFISGLFGRFRRNADGSVECLGLALDTDGKAMKKIANEVRREAEIVRAASTPTVDKLVSSGYDAARAHYRDAIDRGDSEAASRATEAIGRLRRATAEAAAPARVNPETVVTKTCIYPGCGQTFETASSRMMCNEHVHRPEPDPTPDFARPLFTDSIRKAPGRPTEAGPDSNPSRGDQMSRFVPEQGLVSAAMPSPGMLKRIGPSPFSGPPLLDRFVTKKCQTCKEEFQTRSAERTRCDNCLSKPRPTVY